MKKESDCFISYYLYVYDFTVGFLYFTNNRASFSGEDYGISLCAKLFAPPLSIP